MTRREILEASLKKKQAAFDALLGDHFDDVKGAQGEPMAGHRGGEKVLARWEKQNNRLKTLQASIDKTKAALEREDQRGADKSQASNLLSDMPQPIRDLVAEGKLNQWVKYPTVFFVEGVDKARIQYKKGVLSHKYTRSITCKDQWATFRDTFNNLKAKLG